MSDKEQINQSLIYAAFTGNLSEVQDLINNKGADINHQFLFIPNPNKKGALIPYSSIEAPANGDTALHISSRNDKIEIVKFLISKLANPFLLNRINKKKTN